MKRPIKKRRSNKAAVLLVMRLLLSATAFAVEPSNQDGSFLHVITNMRNKQESEENSVVRVIQQPVSIRQEQVCSSSEQARQRLKDLGALQKQAAGTVNVEAGHGDVKIDGNSGQINNSVNVQVVNQNDRKCF